MFKNYINKHNQVGTKLIESSQNIELAYIQIKNSLNKNKKIIFAGNGGSAADAEHLVAEFVCKFNIKRRPLKAISLTSNTSVITAHSNDFGYNSVFKRQLICFADVGDTVILMSTSGNSKNILNCLPLSNKLKINIILLTGLKFNVTSLKNKSNICIKVPSKETSIIQEYHKVIGHYWCTRIDKDFI